ncbi:MAG: hypothetical protein B7Y56_08355 [Gallionellales bacterium 35-53-114]|jgi:hypothetical protein|nr:MAG: hypothetical protein B7Y56_08355 [Gallionellales bacterium 35-53-114]OYZ62638.1 MAG: hypothetical protein B7Y04_12210 [Gallionellales bacterium 24-53-125]OZB09713.1 MAG: hypothetical protein B7X61_04110 [Gallionellales bacterium 39-52-133]HQS57727.1 hypothetical protein [Gallionellaceae bacterium]HQS74180.1 hypothetical protein [Gallionellaceae bacterium]
MKKYIATLLLVLLAACQNTPKLEDDPRYAKLATVIDKHEFSEFERKQAQANSPADSKVSVGVGLGVGIGGGGSFGGMMFGMGSPINSQRDSRDEQPQIAKGAIRYTVQPLGSEERIEVMSYLQYKVGDCVKVLANHPSEYPRFFELKPDEHCQ